MKKYRVVVTPEAKKQMRSYLYYLKYVLKNEQAAVSVRNDYKETIRKLEMVAESIKICENPDLARISWFTGL